MERPAELRPEHLLVLYDGVCALCNRLVRFLLARDRRDRYRFAPLQSELGRRFVARHGGDPDELSTVYLIASPGAEGERAYLRGRAALLSLAGLGGPWALARLAAALPRPLLDLGYRAVARRRYRLFGRYDSCPLPAPEHRHKFIATA